MNRDPKYWDNLIRQYSNETISDEDRFLLEKAALDDPFLFEALEGYALSKTRSASKKTIQPTIKSPTLAWMKIAASFTILVLSFYGISTIFRNMDTSRSAVTETISVESPSEKILAETEALEDFNSTEDVVPKTQAPPQAEKKKLKKKAQKNAAENKAKVNNQRVEREDMEFAKEQIVVLEDVDVKVVKKEEDHKNMPKDQTVLTSRADDAPESKERFFESNNDEAVDAVRPETQSDMVVVDKAKTVIRKDLEENEAVPMASQRKASGFSDEPNYANKNEVKPTKGYDWLDKYLRENIQIDASEITGVEERIVAFDVYITESKVKLVKLNDLFCDNCEDQILKLIYNSGEWLTPTELKTYKIKHEVLF